MNTDVKKVTKRDEVVLVPPVDIHETDDNYVLRCEMPGVVKESIEVTLNNSELEINGRVPDEERSVENLAYAEFRLHNYNRKFVVDENINTQGITANLENGVLTVTLPKSERVKPRKIEITAA